MRARVGARVLVAGRWCLLVTRLRGRRTWLALPEGSREVVLVRQQRGEWLVHEL